VTRAAERELAALARTLPRFVSEDDAGDLLRLDARSVRRHVTTGDLARGIRGTVTRVSILEYLASRQGLVLDELELVLDALDEGEPPQASGQLTILPPRGGVGTGTFGRSTTSD